MSETTNWKNVNNWHWIERDCSEWAHEQVKQRLTGMRVASDSDYRAVQIKTVTSCTGDVTVTQRKGKLKHNFDLNIKFTWTADDGQEGLVEIKDFMSDTNMKGFEFYVKPAEGAKACSQELKFFIMAALRESVWGSLQEFAADLVNEQGRHLLIPTGPNDSDTVAISDNAVAKEFKEGAIAASSSKADTKFASFKAKVNFQAPADQVFAALTEADRVRLWSRNSLVGSVSAAGDKFSLFSGAVTGQVEAIDKAKRSLEMTWRLSCWPAGCESKVKISLEDNIGSSVLNINQSGIPVESYELTTGNWENYYWNPIKATFGFGAFPKF